MMSLISQYDISNWAPFVDDSTKQALLADLEKGQVIYLPELSFTISPADQHFLNPEYLAAGKKKH